MQLQALILLKIMVYKHLQLCNKYGNERRANAMKLMPIYGYMTLWCREGEQGCSGSEANRWRASRFAVHTKLQRPASSIHVQEQRGVYTLPSSSSKHGGGGSGRNRCPATHRRQLPRSSNVLCYHKLIP